MTEKGMKHRDFKPCALCCNHMTSAVACFLASLAVRVSKLERNDI